MADEQEQQESPGSNFMAEAKAALAASHRARHQARADFLAEALVLATLAVAEEVHQHGGRPVGA